MKTIFVTLVSGIFISLITSIGVDTGFEIHPEEFENTTETNQCYYCGEDVICTIECEMESLEFELFSNIQEENIIEPKDIIVYEIEEEVELGFDTKNYLPENFNPYEGMDLFLELIKEEELALKSIINNIEFEKIISIEDVVVYELEEEVETPLVSIY